MADNKEVLKSYLDLLISHLIGIKSSVGQIQDDEILLKAGKLCTPIAHNIDNIIDYLDKFVPDLQDQIKESSNNPTKSIRDFQIDKIV